MRKHTYTGEGGVEYRYAGSRLKGESIWKDGGMILFEVMDEGEVRSITAMLIDPTAVWDEDEDDAVDGVEGEQCSIDVSSEDMWGPGNTFLDHVGKTHDEWTKMSFTDRAAIMFEKDPGFTDVHREGWGYFRDIEISNEIWTCFTGQDRVREKELLEILNSTSAYL